MGKIGTRFARRHVAKNIEILYAYGLWTHREESYYFPDSAKFDYTLRDLSQWDHQAERYIADTREFWLRHYAPQEGDIVIDVGAGHGEDTLAFSRAVGKSGRVIAIEAHPGTFAVLKNFCRLNHLDNVTPLQVALMDKPGVARIVETGSSWQENSIELGDGTVGVQVPAHTLDEILRDQDVKDIAFLKMNIEGAERYALLGMESTISRIRQICVACHDFRSDMGHGEQFRTRKVVEELLAVRGFKFTFRPNDPRDYVRDHVFGLRAN